MKRIIRFLLLGLFFLLAIDADAQRKTLAVGRVKVMPALEIKVATSGEKADLNRIVESLDGQLISAIHGTRKFEIVARSDIESIFEEQDSFSPGSISGVDFVTIPKIDDFQDRFQRATFATLGTSVSRRTIRMSLLLKIYETKKAKLLETANILIERTLIEESSPEPKQRFRQYTRTVPSRNDDATDALLLEMAKEAALKSAQRVADVIYPAKVLAITGKIVTLNRGDGTGIRVGQIWDIFAAGEELIDPDTGEVLGVEEIQIGKARIISVLPKFSRGEVTENFGIEKGALLRPVTTQE